MSEEMNPAVPPEFGRILSKLLEKDRTLRCQIGDRVEDGPEPVEDADLDSGSKRAAEVNESEGGTP